MTKITAKSRYSRSTRKGLARNATCVEIDGEVIKIEDSNIYGKVLTIKHNNNLVSVYSNIKDILVSVGYKVTTGEIIASSNKSIYENNNKSLLHFEMYYNDKTINPESVYTLSVSELE